MSKLKDAEIRNLRQRLQKATADAKRWKKRAAELDHILNMTDEDFFEVRTLH